MGKSPPVSVSRDMPKTGDTCQASGAYRCDSCGAQTIPVARGERFPPCAGESKPVTWMLISAGAGEA